MRARTHRKDTTHDAYTAWLEARGWLVIDTHNLDAFVDAIGIKGGRVVFIEFKGGRCAAERKAKPHQEALHVRLRLYGAEAALVASMDDLAQFERP